MKQLYIMSKHTNAKYILNTAYIFDLHIKSARLANPLIFLKTFFLI